MNRELRAVFFDFDGTIAETERHGHRVAYNKAFAERGLGWDWDERLYGELLAVAGGKERLRYYIDRYRPDLGGQADTAEFIAGLHRAKSRRFREVAPEIPLRPGIRRLMLEAQAAGVRVAIATTAGPEGVEALLSQDPALLKAIDLIAAGDVVRSKKPAPDIYLWALERLQLPAEACVAVEDASIGLRSALAAGIKTLVTVSDYSAGQDFTGASAVVSDLGEENAPARSIAGLVPPRGVVDVAFLRTLLKSP